MAVDSQDVVTFVTGTVIFEAGIAIVMSETIETFAMGPLPFGEMSIVTGAAATVILIPEILELGSAVGTPVLPPRFLVTSAMEESRQAVILT